MRLIFGWWEREIRIWWLPCHNEASLGTKGDGSGFQHVRTKKLAARIALQVHSLIPWLGYLYMLTVCQGDETLSCVDMSMHGKLLVACTISKVKLFYLRQKDCARLKVSKLEALGTLTECGAKIAKFSPDGKWLLLISPNNDIRIFRLVRDKHADKPRFRTKVVHLKRLTRDPIKTKVQCGSLGNYERSISRVAFSADSRICAIGDLSGHLDTWVLEGHEDITQEHDEEPDEPEPSESSDMESTDEGHAPNVIFGQNWIRNPAASLLPRLPAAPLVLSFRPLKTHNTLNLDNGNIGLHPNSHKPHPHSYDLPDGEDRLFAFTSNHKIYEFDVLKGRLSDWSRKNHSSSLPAKFQQIKEPAMGLVWDVSLRNERVWLYGASWLWMFDLSKNFPIGAEIKGQSTKGKTPQMPNGINKRKRRREDVFDDPRRNEDGRRHYSGAGGKKPRLELDIGIGRRFHQSDAPDLANDRWVSTDAERIHASSDDDDDDDGGNEPTENLPVIDYSTAESGERVQITNGITKDAQRGDSETHCDGRGPQAGPPYWGTHQYRDILGITSLEGQDENQPEEENPDDDESAHRLEVALVERPIREVDLPPRYEGNQEWNKQLGYLLSR